jgi:hypothetical protein
VWEAEVADFEDLADARFQHLYIVCMLFAACPVGGQLQVWEAEVQDFEDLADAEAHPADPAAPHISHIEASKILRVNALQVGLALGPEPVK